MHVRRDPMHARRLAGKRGRIGRAYFSLVPLNRILDLLRRVAEEVVCLALHRTDSALHPGHPFHDFPVPRSRSRVKDCYS